MTTSTANPPPAENGRPRIWRRWFTPRSTDRERAFVERTLRGIVPITVLITVLLNTLAMNVLSLAIYEVVLTIALPVLALFALMLGRTYLSGTLIIVYFLVALVASSFFSGYWGGAVSSIAILLVLLSSLILPQRMLPWITLGVLLVIAGAVAVQVQNGIIPPLNEDGEPFTTPSLILFPTAFTLTFVLAYVIYLRREFKNRVDEINDLVANLETRVLERTRDLAASMDDARQAREEAEKADMVKSAFLASMSHELRTPLNAIINFSKFLKKGVPGPINEEQEQLIGSIADSGQHLLNLINDVLDMSKIEAGSLKLYVEADIDLRPVIETAIQYTRPLLVDKSVEIHLDVPDDLPRLTGDRKRLLQIFLNILSNACKFTEAGYVKVQAESRADRLLISVRDSGQGIAPEDAGHVFTAFKQTESGLRQGGGGTGLGMPICQKLVEAHEGRIWFESQVGVGTTFFVELPLQKDLQSERSNRHA